MHPYLRKLLRISRQAILRHGNSPRPEAESRHRINQFVDLLDYDFTDYTLLGLIDFLNTYLPRPIHLIYFPTVFPQAIGLWYHTPGKEFVVVPTGPQFHPLLQEHIALHEIAHILLGHPPIPITELNLWGDIQSSSHELTGRALHFKPNYLLQPAEQEAEYLATLIQQRVIQAQQQAQLRQQGSSIAGLSPLASDLAFDENTF